MTKIQELALRKVLAMLRKWEQRHDDWVVSAVRTSTDMNETALIVRVELRHVEPGAYRGLL